MCTNSSWPACPSGSVLPLFQWVQLCGCDLALCDEPRVLCRVTIELAAVLLAHFVQADEPWLAAARPLSTKRPIDHRGHLRWHSAASVVPVIMRRYRAHELHLVVRRKQGDAARVPACIEDVALARRRAANKIDEILHLLRRAKYEPLFVVHRRNGNVAPGQELSHPDATFGSLLCQRGCALNLSIACRRKLLGRLVGHM